MGSKSLTAPSLTCSADEASGPATLAPIPIGSSAALIQPAAAKKPDARQRHQAQGQTIFYRLGRPMRFSRYAVRFMTVSSGEFGVHCRSIA